MSPKMDDDGYYEVKSFIDALVEVRPDLSEKIDSLKRHWMNFALYDSRKYLSPKYLNKFMDIYYDSHNVQDLVNDPYYLSGFIKYIFYLNMQCSDTYYEVKPLLDDLIGECRKNLVTGEEHTVKRVNGYLYDHLSKITILFDILKTKRPDLSTKIEQVKNAWFETTEFAFQRHVSIDKIHKELMNLNCEIYYTDDFIKLLDFSQVNAYYLCGIIQWCISSYSPNVKDVEVMCLASELTQECKNDPLSGFVYSPKRINSECFFKMNINELFDVVNEKRPDLSVDIEQVKNTWMNTVKKDTGKHVNVKVIHEHLQEAEQMVYFTDDFKRPLDFSQVDASHVCDYIKYKFSLSLFTNTNIPLLLIKDLIEKCKKEPVQTTPFELKSVVIGQLKNNEFVVNECIADNKWYQIILATMVSVELFQGWSDDGPITKTVFVLGKKSIYDTRKTLIDTHLVHAKMIYKKDAKYVTTDPLYFVKNEMTNHQLQQHQVITDVETDGTLVETNTVMTDEVYNEIVTA